MGEGDSKQNHLLEDQNQKLGAEPNLGEKLQQIAGAGALGTEIVESGAQVYSLLSKEDVARVRSLTRFLQVNRTQTI